MPFAYYGAKHGLASKYPRPRFDMIIEPFAGAAGYSCHHAALGKRVILNDLDPLVSATWVRLKKMTEQDVIAVGGELDKERTMDPLVCMGFGALSTGGSVKVTSRMRTEWHSPPRRSTRNRIIRAVRHAAEWEIRSGDYRDLPDVKATWFIDPPYQPIMSQAGNGYAEGAKNINYSELAEWCQSRSGQVIVCEQSPAEWLPFTPIAVQGTTANNSDTRTEVVWLSDQQQGSLFEPAEGNGQ